VCGEQCGKRKVALTLGFVKKGTEADIGSVFILRAEERARTEGAEKPMADARTAKMRKNLNMAACCTYR